MSQKLNSAQRNYTVTELECFAAVLGVKKFRAYIEGTPFKIVTDHASLKWLMTQKDLSGRLARWSLKLQAYDFTIEHRKGSANVVPDALSRMHAEQITISISTFGIDLNSEEFKSEEYTNQKNTVQNNKDVLPDVKVDGNHIYKRTFSTDGAQVPIWRLWVPERLRLEIIKNAHDPSSAAHGGFVKTLEQIKRYYYWPRMAYHIKEYVNECTTCKETKAPNYTLRPPMGNQFKVERAFQHLYVDLLGPYPRSKRGNSYLFIILDQFSKYVLLKQLRQATSKNIIEYLDSEVFSVYGVPETLLSDNGVQFASKDFSELLSSYGIKHIFTASHAPQANASERVNRSILSAIRSYLGNDQREWDVHISQIAGALRNSVHSSTKHTPHYLVFGNHKVQHASAYPLLRKLGCLADPESEVLCNTDLKQLIFGKVTKNLKKAHERHQKTYNIRSKNVVYKPGEEVYRRNFAQSSFKDNFNAKLAKKFIKCRVVKRIGTALYELEDMNGKKLTPRYHAKDLRR